MKHFGKRRRFSCSNKKRETTKWSLIELVVRQRALATSPAFRENVIVNFIYGFSGMWSGGIVVKPHAVRREAVSTCMRPEGKVDRRLELASSEAKADQGNR